MTRTGEQAPLRTTDGRVIRTRPPRVSGKLRAALDAGMSSWWLWLWGVNAVALIGVAFVVPFRWWALATVVCFGTMEGIGVKVHGSYPPLTDVIRAFVPYWLALLAIWALMGAAGGAWGVWADSGHHLLRLAGWFGLAGWFTAHFTQRYAP